MRGILGGASVGVGEREDGDLTKMEAARKLQIHSLRGELYLPIRAAISPENWYLSLSCINKKNASPTRWLELVAYAIYGYAYFQAGSAPSVTSEASSVRRSGRPRVISEAHDKTSLAWLMDKDINGATHVAQQLVAQGITQKVVSKGTIITGARRTVAKLHKNLVVKRGPPSQGLRHATQENRLSFAKANLKRTWSHVLLTDRMMFYISYLGSRVKPANWVFEKGEWEWGSV